MAIGRRLLLAMPRVSPVRTGHIRQPVIVLSMLHQVLGANPVAAHLRIPRKLLILLIDLIGIATDPYARAVAIQSMRAWVMPPPRAAISRPLDVRALSHILNQSG